MASTSMIKRLWNDRRGASAWVVTIAMVPLLGMVSLGTEVGSWYVIRRHAQSAADAAAIAGATALVVNDPTGRRYCWTSLRQLKWICDGGWLSFDGKNRSERLHYLFGHGRDGHDGHGRRHTVREADLYPMVRSSRSGHDTGHSSCRKYKKSQGTVPSH